MLAITFAFLSTVLLHPSAESLAEVQWNASTQKVEVALRLRIADEQRLLQSVSSQSATAILADEAALERAGLSVIRRRIGFGKLNDLQTNSNVQEKPNGADVAKRYQWIGRRSEGGHAWWFFEIATPSGRPTHLRCTLFEKPNDPRNRNDSSHDHLHAMPVSTFLILPDALPASVSPVKGRSSSPRPNSMTMTPEHPMSEIQWVVPAS
ncbi:MAG: DUF6702 family protein [Rhodopirellula sp. JB044]|uniref:DUF6702 family protein n=1 Tax=Rhodopirellula sp. JB044 TaxID=3342844 RepID=UPI003709CFC6